MDLRFTSYRMLRCENISMCSHRCSCQKTNYAMHLISSEAYQTRRFRLQYTADMIYKTVSAEEAKMTEPDTLLQFLTGLPRKPGRPRKRRTASALPRNSKKRTNLCKGHGHRKTTCPLPDGVGRRRIKQAEESHRRNME